MNCGLKIRGSLCDILYSTDLKPLVENLQLLACELGVLHGRSEDGTSARVQQVLSDFQQGHVPHGLDRLIGYHAKGLVGLLDQIGHR